MKMLRILLTALLLSLAAAAQARAATFVCGTCPDCSSKISSAGSGDTVQLEGSITNYPGTCISFGGKDNLTFDCLGNMIDGYDSGYGIWLNGSDSGSNSNTIMNCVLRDFEAGVQIENSSNNSFLNITASRNQRGLHFFGLSQGNSVSGSRIEGNSNRGIYMEASGTDYPTQNIFYNNILNNSVNFGSNNDNNVNYLNATNSTGPNIIGGPYTGGNYWASPSGNGYSQTCPDSDSNGFCDSIYQPDPANTDYLPITEPKPDTTPPRIDFTLPTPANGTNATYNYIEVNASLSEAASCLLDWSNGTFSSNESMTVSGLNCYLNKTSLPNGTYSFRVYANDSLGNMNSSELRYAAVSFSAPVPEPQISITLSINPRSVRTGNSTALSVNVSSSRTINKIILTITLPNSSSAGFQLSGNTTMNYIPPLPGLYNLTVFANDTYGYSRSVADNLTASGLINFTSKASNYNGTGIPCKMEFYYPGTSSKVAEFQSDSGNFTGLEILEQVYDILFKTYGDKLHILLKNVNISQNLNRQMGFDNPQMQNYSITYAVSNTYSMTSASVRIYYSGINEDYIDLYRCQDWNFSGRVCLGSWEQLSFTQNNNENWVALDVASFSAFSLMQEQFCGDGICQQGEDTSTCSQDCDCEENETMECGAGNCSGIITCHSGKWGTECEVQVRNPEWCNRNDDDCNGIVDDVNNGTSVQSSQCQCYGGRPPAAETCNGIDDDCNGLIDDNAICCANGATRPCGSSTGVCSPGTSTCSGGLWGPCLGSLGPDPSETCGNGLDDDCDGLTDEECITCTDNDGDGYGSPASNACTYPEPDCSDSDRQANPGLAEVCDGKDNNCNGEADEGLSCGTCNNGEQDGTETGIDCGGDCPACPFYKNIWFYVSLSGAGILGFLLFMYFRLRKQGRELSWDELMKKWTPAAK